jgi:hypothetical protein
MSPEETEILAVERKLARGEQEARTLWREIAAIRQGLAEAYGVLEQAPPAGHVLEGYGTYGNTLTLSDSEFGPVTLTWDAATLNWIGSRLVNTARSIVGCNPQVGVKVAYTLNWQAFAQRINIVYSSFPNSFCNYPVASTTQTTTLAARLYGGQSSSPLNLVAQVTDGPFNYLYSVPGVYPVLTVTEPGP